MEKKFKKNKLNNLGFTMVETLVAVSILSLSILAGFTAVQGGLKSSQNVKNQITAFFLAQEAMELVKNIRDDNALNFIDGGSNTWLTGLSVIGTDPCYFGNSCYIDATTKTATRCSGTCPVIRMQSSNGLWGYNAGWTATIFTRSVSLQTVALNSNEISVTVNVSWTEGSATKSFQVTQSLFDRSK